MTTGGSGGRGRTADADAFRSSERRIPKGPDPIHNRSRGIPNTARPESTPDAHLRSPRLGMRCLQACRQDDDRAAPERLAGGRGTTTKATTGRFRRRSSSCSIERLDGKDELPDLQFVSHAEDEISAKRLITQQHTPSMGILVILGAGRQAGYYTPLLLLFFEVFEEQEKKRTELNTPLDSRPGSVRSSRRLLAPTVLHRVKKNAEPSDQNVAKKQMSEAWCVRVQQARRQITAAECSADACAGGPAAKDRPRGIDTVVGGRGWSRRPGL
ncbi:unnamed protein product [Miscanthus lutarioriparius]|uniref:Uncharacterized protein n=1 Tax=Miscanthus lutarioriparius TaxID=422564 RepID=A0A811RWP6_9POAL|nr:unnamed protein product [Miscanthus lutarioriparius]